MSHSKANFGRLHTDLYKNPTRVLRRRTAIAVGMVTAHIIDNAPLAILEPVQDQGLGRGGGFALAVLLALDLSLGLYLRLRKWWDDDPVIIVRMRTAKADDLAAPREVTTRQGEQRPI